MRTTLLCALVLASTALACGGEETGTTMRAMEIGFRMHALECERPGIQAKLDTLRASAGPDKEFGDEGVCLLPVDANRMVRGTCYDVPAGDVIFFRLVYYITFQGAEGDWPVDVELATAVDQLDLRNQRQRTVRLEFGPDQLYTELDTDGDGRTNLQEFCEGTNPLARD